MPFTPVIFAFMICLPASAFPPDAIDVFARPLAYVAQHAAVCEGDRGKDTCEEHYARYKHIFAATMSSVKAIKAASSGFHFR
jgi:hypothetical protein